jgi:hypothetical protein
MGWKTAAVELGKPDQVAGVKAAFEEAAGLVRVTVCAAESREVSWKIRFTAR